MDSRHTQTGSPVPSSSRTVTLERTPASDSQHDVGILRLRPESRSQRVQPATNQATASSSASGSARRVVWSEETVDNEGLGRKKSKICCIYHKPKAFDESSDESSSSSSASNSDSDSSSEAPSSGEADSHRPSLSQAAREKLKQRRKHRHHHHHTQECSASSRTRSSSSTVTVTEPHPQPTHHHADSDSDSEPSPATGSRPNAYERGTT